MSTPENRAAWQIDDFVYSTGICRTKVFEFIKTGELPTVKVGKRRLILKSPKDFLSEAAQRAA